MARGALLRGTPARGHVDGSCSGVQRSANSSRRRRRRMLRQRSSCAPPPSLVGGALGRAISTSLRHPTHRDATIALKSKISSASMSTRALKRVRCFIPTGWRDTRSGVLPRRRIGIFPVSGTKGASFAPLRGETHAAPRRTRAPALLAALRTIGDSTSVPCLPTAQAMGSLACDEGATAAPASGSSKRDTLEPSLRARFKHMQKIGEGTYGVVPQWSKSGSPHVPNGRAPSGASGWSWLCSLRCRRALSL